jgi:dihydroorotase
MKIDFSSGPDGKLPITLTMTRPDDMHLHIREGIQMACVLANTTRQFGRAIIMPNLKPPIATVAQARNYHDAIRIVLNGLNMKKFEPLMTLYLTDNTSPDEITRAKESGLVYGVKYYPAGATTNSDSGVTEIEKVYPVLERMEEVGMPLLMHGEVTNPSVDIFDREEEFLTGVFKPVRKEFPNLKMVLEHITTLEAVHFVHVEVARGKPTAATITAHHLLKNRNALFSGGIRPHNYCLPVLKREEDRQALLQAAISGNSAFFLGTDSAPHAQHLKENACGCAGCFTAYHALELYAKAFESVGSLGKLEDFASHFGANFYGIPRNTGMVTLVREEWAIPAAVKFGDSAVVPFLDGEKLKWKVM